MQCKEITGIIEKQYPKYAALGFDNVGLQAGRSTKEVKKIYLALDATDTVIDAAIEEGADMLITHHPLIFSPLKAVTDEDFISRRIVKLIQNDISYYAMHTNYDVLGMAELVGELLELREMEVLDVTTVIDEKEEGIGKVGFLPREMNLQECCEFVKEKLKLPHVKVFGNPEKHILRLAVSPGSGKSALRPAIEKKADVLVTGDIGHHEGLDAAAQNLMVIDAGHYGTEYFFVEDMKEYLQREVPGVQVITEPVSHPFSII